ncbi:8-oxo-dGTP diphosphatase [Enterococcus nangangensis]|uniref:8-oxo-dGTP diphosphatase n=1 Tax=Enterococcus nangangensis TaxID=2559926 RepID=UPI0010F47E6B|nr:8-oxo-dGTP diphosphatase [Enterococcus nangangensis]
MAESEAAIFTNMCMIENEYGEVLVEDRQKKDWPGLTFPGGHVELGESFVEACQREVWEETGLTVTNLHLCGVKQFQTRAKERYVIFFYRTKHFSGKLQASAEGPVYWLPKGQLKKQKVAPDFLEMVQVMEDENLSEFFYQQAAGDWEIELR